MSRRRFAGLLGCGLVLIGLTAAGLHVPRDDDLGWFVAIALAQGAVYLVAIWLMLRRRGSSHPVPLSVMPAQAGIHAGNGSRLSPGRQSGESSSWAGDRWCLALILGAALAMRIVVLLGPPFLSSDVYRYVWDGRVMAAGINPYRYIPTDPQLAALRDAEIFPEINRGNYAPTIYPPAAEAIFFAATRFSESLTAMKAAMVVFEAIAVVLVLSLLAGAGLPATRIIIYAWHPLPLWEFAGNGHIDAAIVAFVALALWSRRRTPPSLSSRRRPGSMSAVDTGLRRNDKKPGSGWLTGFALAAATLVKFYPIVLFPALWRRWDWRMPALFACVLVLAYLPFLGVGWGIFGFLPGYLAEEGFTSGGGGFYLWSLARAALPPGAFPDVAYLAMVAGLLGGLAAYVAWMRPGPDSDVFGAALLAGAFVVLLSPHYPWYFAWLIVFACLIPSVSLVWLTLASFLLYLVPVGSQLVRDRHRFLAETAIYVPFLALAALDLWRRRAAGSGARPGSGG